MIVTTDALVLKGMKYRETSRILTMFTRDWGKVSVIAKGARAQGSRFYGALDPLSHVRMVMYKKDSRDLQFLSQCDLLDSHRTLSCSIEHMPFGLAVIELLNITTHQDETNIPLFDLTLQTLRAMNSATKNTVLALYYFEMKIIEILGFRPQLDRCAICGLGREEDEQFTMGFGGIVCSGCSSNTELNVSRPVVEMLRYLQRTPSPQLALQLELSPSLKTEVGNALRVFLQHHIDGFRGLKSESVFASFV